MYPLIQIGKIFSQTILGRRLAIQAIDESAILAFIKDTDLNNLNSTVNEDYEEFGWLDSWADA